MYAIKLPEFKLMWRIDSMVSLIFLPENGLVRSTD